MKQEIHGQHEQGIEIPIERIPPDTLLNMVTQFVTRQGADLDDGGYSLEDKVEQVMGLLREKRVKVTYDLASETWNIIEQENCPLRAT